MNRTQQLIAKGRNEFAKTIAMYEELAKSGNEIVAEGSAAMAEIVRGWAANDKKCEALGFKCGA